MKKLPKQKDSLIGDLEAPAPELSSADLARVVDAATFGDGGEIVRLGGYDIQIVDLKWGIERRMLQIVSPYLRLLTDAVAVGQLEEALGALLVEAHYDLTRLATVILTPQAPMLLGPEEYARIAAGGPVEGLEPGKNHPVKLALAQAVANWLDENAQFEEIVTLVRAQVKRNKLADSLGKLWEPGALHLRALRLLATLESQIMQATPSN